MHCHRSRSVFLTSKVNAVSATSTRPFSAWSVCPSIGLHCLFVCFYYPSTVCVRLPHTGSQDIPLFACYLVYSDFRFVKFRSPPTSIFYLSFYFSYSPLPFPVTYGYILCCCVCNLANYIRNWLLIFNFILCIFLPFHSPVHIPVFRYFLYNNFIFI